MATRKKDVELVVRAKDQASKTVDAIAGAITDLVASQSKLATSADRSDSSLDKLGNAFSALNKELRGSNVGTKLTEEFKKAESAIGRLDTALKKSLDEQKRVNAEIVRATGDYDKLAASQDRARIALEKETESRRKSKSELTAANAALRTGEAARTRLASTENKLTATIEKQQGVLREAAEKYSRLGTEVSAAEAPTKRLTQTYERSGAALDRAKAKLTGLESKLAETRASATEAASGFTVLETKANEAAAGFERQAAATTEASTKYKELGVQTKTAGKFLSGLRDDAVQVGDAIESQNGQLAKARTEYRQFGVAVGKAQEELRILAGVAGSGLDAALDDQTAAVARAKTEWTEASESVLKLSRDLNKAEQAAASSVFGSKAAEDVKKLSLAFDEARVSSDSAEKEFQEQRTALASLSAIAAETGGDIDLLADRQRRFAETQEATAKSITKIRTASETNIASLRKQAAAADQAAGSNTRLGGAVRGTETSMRGATTAGGALAAAYRKLYGDSRQALNIQQRLRGEILALTTNYLGFFAALQGIRGVTDAFQDLQAAQVKLGVVFDGEQTAREMQVVRDSAQRLGFDFGTLANAYANLQIATDASEVSAADTRKLFLSISSASRVLQLDNEKLKRTFQAFAQIAQKGVVSMEELRQQLSENFPGSIEIFAKAAGFGADQLDEFYAKVADGKVSANILGDVADEIDAKYGSQVPDSLDTFAVALGRAQNAAFEAALVVGEAGLIGALQNLLQTLADTASTSEFQAFLRNVGAGAGQVVDAISFLVENFQSVITVLSAMVGIKLSGFFLALVGGMLRTTAATRATTVAARATTLGFTNMQATILGLRAGFVALRGAITAALISTGIGAVIVGLTTLFGTWLTAVESTTRSLEDHEKIVSQVRGAYNAASGDVEKWNQALKDLTVTEAKRNLESLKASIKEIVAEINNAAQDGGGTFGGRFFGIELNGASGEYRKAVEEVIAATNRGEIKLQDIRGEFDKLAVTYADQSEANTRLADSLDLTSSELANYIDKAVEANDILLKVGEDTDEAAAATERLAARYGDLDEEQAEALDNTKDNVEAVNSALEQMAGIVPRITGSLEDIKKTDALEKLYQDAIKLATTMGQVLALTQQFNDSTAALGNNAAFDSLSGFSSGTEAAAALIRDQEGFRSTPYFDVNAQRAGFGSDTITLADGTVKAVTKGITVSVADANRDLLRRINTEFLPQARNSVGAGRFDALAPQQQAVLTSLAYNYGQLPSRIADAVRSGASDADIGNAIKRLSDVTDNSSKLNQNEKAALRKRRSQEGAIFARAGSDSGVVEAQVKAQVKADEESAKAAAKKAEEQAKYKASLDAGIAQQQFENSIVDEGLIARETALAIREAELKAQAAGTTLSEAERKSIEDVTRAKFAQQASEEAIEATRENAAKAEEEVNALLARRAELLKQLEIFQANGNDEQAEQARAGIAELNTELGAATEAAIRMWEAVGGPGATAAIEKLRTASLEAQNFKIAGDQSKITWERVGQAIGTRVVSAFDSFAQSVAEGKSVGESARIAFLQFASDFLREIAQMIIKQALLNALSAATGGAGGGFLGGIVSGLAHTGGVVGSARTGSGNASRRVSPSVFAGAGRFHEGGLPGLRANEVATILKKGEEVVTEDDPRHMKNGGGAGGTTAAPANVKVVNTFDAPDMMDVALQDQRGQDVVLNFMRSNAAAVRAAIG